MFKRLWLLALCWKICNNAIAQTSEPKDTLQAKSELAEVVVSGSKFDERNSKVAVSIRTIRKADLQRLNTSNMANLLETSGFAFVQKSQQGGGSPVIRGFEASRIVLMVDGVRMNNAIYRSGHLQNIITVDPNILERLEVLYGPSSTLFGSDALGGVVNIFTTDPKLSSDSQKSIAQLNAQIRYSSAIREKMIHADMNFGGNKWGSFTSVTRSDFGNITIGRKSNKDYPNFGLSAFYVKRINGRDTSLVNNNPHKLIPSGYNQWDLMQKILYSPNANTIHLLNIQFSNSSDIPRFDRLSELAADHPRFAEWNYGPQKRRLTSYKLEKKDLKAFLQEVRVVASHQFVEESRNDRRFQQSVRNERIEKINVIGITVDARKKMNRHEAVIGAETQINDLKSVARGFNVDNSSIIKVPTRYPDGVNSMSYGAVYIQHLYKITPQLTLNDGLRLNYVHLQSRFIDTTLMHFPFTSAKQDNVALSGNAGIVYSTDDKFKIASVFSTGFRAPNFDDLAKVFDSRAGAVIVPNPGLKPEYTYNVELNFIKYFPVKNQPFGAGIGGSVFYTAFKNAIVVDRYILNDTDSIIYNGVRSAVLASQNKAKAHLSGWNLYGHVKLTNMLQLNGMITYTHGRYLSNNSKIPLDHIPPVYGKFSFLYDRKKFSAELNLLFNGWKRIENYNPSGEDNQQYATAEGMPGWKTVNARVNYHIGGRFKLQGGIENIFDVRYRTFSSGLSAPGRNFILALKTTM